MHLVGDREGLGYTSGVGSISWLVRRGRGRATTCELYAKIIAESELLQPVLNEIHKFCFQHWSRGRGTCGTGSVAPVYQFDLLIHEYGDSSFSKNDL